MSKLKLLVFVHKILFIISDTSKGKKIYFKIYLLLYNTLAWNYVEY